MNGVGGPKKKGKQTSEKASTKAEMFQAVAEASGLTRKQVASVFDALTSYVKGQVGKKGPGVVVLAGLLKIKRVHKAATPERIGRNPATGEPMMVKAKSARTVVKAQALKLLKDLVK